MVQGQPRGRLALLVRRDGVSETVLADEVTADTVLWTTTVYAFGAIWHPGPAHVFASGLPIAPPVVERVVAKKAVRKKQEPAGLNFDAMR